MNMNAIFILVRWFIAALMFVSTVIFSYLTLRRASQDQPGTTTGDQTCLQCRQVRPGAQAVIATTQSVESLRRQFKHKKDLPSETKILNTETQFICDPCTRRYIKQEICLQILIVLPYAVYAMLVNVSMDRNGLFPNILLEAFLLVLAIAGALAAWNLYQALGAGESPLDEIRDRVAIQLRKKSLGKGFGYYTRAGMRYLKK
jgi:hypothetical protein